MRNHTIAISILLGHLILFSFLSLFLNPHPDMIDHWVWAQHLSLSYYEHPPMVALAIRLFTSLLGNSELVLEFAAQFYNLFIMGLGYAICYKLFGKTTAIFYLILLESTPYYFLGSMFLHIDQPFLIFWLINLYLLCRFHQSPSPRGFLLIGVVAGLGALSKYITILFYLGLFVHLLIYKPLRKHLTNPWLYVAGIVSLIFITPVLLWNYQNDWVSFKFQFGRGLSGAPLGQNLINFTLGHLVLFSVIWSIWGLYTMWKEKPLFAQGQRPESVIIVLSLVPLAFFTTMSIRGSIADPHWANVAYLGIFMLAAQKLTQYWKTDQQGFVKRMVIGGIVLNAGLSSIVFLMIQFPLFHSQQYHLKYAKGLLDKGLSLQVMKQLEPLSDLGPQTQAEFVREAKALIAPEMWNQYSETIINIAKVADNAPLNRLIGWETTASQIMELLKMVGHDSIDYVISKEFQLSSMLSFYLPNFPLPHSIEKPERNQWSPVADVRDKKAVILCKPQRCYRVVHWVKERFQKEVTFLGTIETESNGRLVRNLDVYTMNIQKNAL